ncbi:MAG: hypothetical protein AAF799_38160 [Myxococcota bacterium]
MPHQLWATFSVKDHCRRGSFIAEVLLYDKLIIPVVPKAEDGLPEEEATKEWQRWTDNGWDPERQDRVVAILGDLARPVPWIRERQDEWQQEKVQQVAADARRDGYFMTGTVLERFAPAMAETVVAVSHYDDVEALKRGQHIRRTTPEDKLPGSTVLAVLGRELLVPDHVGKDDFGALEDAVEVARTTDYRQRRRLLYEWQRDFIKDGDFTDATAVIEAVEHMKTLVADLEEATRRAKRWTTIKKIFSFFKLGTKVASVTAPALAPITKGAEVVVDIGTFAANAMDNDPVPSDEGLPAATLLLDARQRLEIEQ